MQNNYTEDLLIQYIYNELDRKEYTLVENKLIENLELKKELEVYNRLIRHLDDLKVNPDQRTIDSILEYSRRKSVNKIK